MDLLVIRWLPTRQAGNSGQINLTCLFAYH